MDLPFLIDQRARRDLGPDDTLLGAQVEDFRTGSFLRLPDHERLALVDPRDLARGIVEVAEDPAFGRADAHAGRQQPVLHAVRAEVALFRGARVRIDEELIVRTRFHACAAPDAGLAVEIDDAVAAFEERIRRTDAHARCVGALVAENGEEEPARVRKDALFNRLDPTAIHADRNVVLRLARNRARVAPDAFAQIDREPVGGHSGF